VTEARAQEPVARFARSGRAAALCGLAWGFAEGLFFFVVPDVYISYATLFSLRAGALAWLGSIAGSLVAVLAIAAILGPLHLDYLGFLGAVPGISPALLDGVARGLREGGLPYSPLVFLRGVPLKVYAAEAFSAGTPLAGVLAWTVVARLIRIAPTFAVAAVSRRVLGRRIESRPAAWCGVLVAFWGIFYLFYFAAMSRG